MRRLNVQIRTIIVAILLFLPVATLAGSLKVEAIASLGPGRLPQWSPSGRYLAFVADNKLVVTSTSGHSGRYEVADLPMKKCIWASDSEFVYVRDQGRNSPTWIFESLTFQVSRIDPGRDTITRDSLPSVLYTLEIERDLPERESGPIRLIDGALGYLQVLGSNLGPAVFVPFDSGNKLTTRERNWPWLYTREEGEEFAPSWGETWMKPISTPLTEVGRCVYGGRCLGFSHLSPSGDRVAICCGDHWVLVDTAGKVLNERFGVMYREDTTGLLVGTNGLEWSAQGGFLAFTRDWEDGHYDYRSQICVSDVSSEKFTIVGECGAGNGFSYSWSPQDDLLAVSMPIGGIRIFRISVAE